MPKHGRVIGHGHSAIRIGAKKKPLRHRKVLDGWRARQDLNP
jgi:hypothetical protein